MDPHDIAPRLGQLPARLTTDPGSCEVRAVRSHGGRTVQALAASQRAGLCVRSQLVAPSHPAARELSQRLRMDAASAHDTTH